MSVLTNRAFGAGDGSGKVKLGSGPPDPLSDGLWTAIVDNCKESTVKTFYVSG